MGRRIFCLGDSNTYGYDPREPFGARYARSERWPERLADETGWEVLNHGENGRVIPRGAGARQLLIDQILRAQPLDLVVILLGSNDVLAAFEPDAEQIAARMDEFLTALRAQTDTPLLLIAPPDIRLPLPEARAAIEALADDFRALAARHGAAFADAHAWPLALAHDGVHFTSAAHALFRQRIRAVIEALPEFSRSPTKPQG